MIANPNSATLTPVVERQSEPWRRSQYGLLLTADEVAHLLRLKVGTVKTLRRCGDLPGVVIGNCLRWRIEEVEAFVDGLKPGGPLRMPPERRRGRKPLGLAEC